MTCSHVHMSVAKLNLSKDHSFGGSHTRGGWPDSVEAASAGIRAFTHGMARCSASFKSTFQRLGDRSFGRTVSEDGFASET